MKRIIWAAATAAVFGLCSQHLHGADAPKKRSPAAPTIAAAERPAPSPKDSPKESLLGGSQAAERLDSDLLTKFYEATTPLEKEFARSASDYAIEVTRVELAVRKRWGRKEDDRFVHGIGEKTDDDIRAADFKVDGDKATVLYKGDAEPAVSFVRINGVWKYDVHADVKDRTDDEVKDWTKQNESVAKKIAPYAAKVEKGEYKDPDSVTADVKRIIDADETSNP